MRIPSRDEALTDVGIKALAQPAAARRRAARIMSLQLGDVSRAAHSRRQGGFEVIAEGVVSLQTDPMD